VATLPGLYTIRIKGRLGATALSAFLEDRSAVFGVLAQIEALGLELLELQQLRAGSESHRSVDARPSLGA
jgi:hypothetical protein